VVYGTSTLIDGVASRGFAIDELPLPAEGPHFRM